MNHERSVNYFHSQKANKKLIECSFALLACWRLNEAMKVSLLVAVPGGMEGKEIPITLSEFLIGRDPDCHICPSSPRVGQRHCAFLIRNQRVYLRAFDTIAGTFINDRRVDGEAQLLDGDLLKIGPLLFRLSIEASPDEPLS
jgi:hypothetical protein